MQCVLNITDSDTKEKQIYMQIHRLIHLVSVPVTFISKE